MGIIYTGLVYYNVKKGVLLLSVAGLASTYKNDFKHLIQSILLTNYRLLMADCTQLYAVC